MKFESIDEATLVRLGKHIGQHLKGGEVIELIGDVGAGKTTLTRAIARGLGIDETIHSPTFTISNRYQSDTGLELAHYDFYRLSDAGIMAEELAEVMEASETITIIEWGDVLPDILPASKITIRLTSPSEERRDLDITADSDGMQRLEGVAL